MRRSLFVFVAMLGLAGAALAQAKPINPREGTFTASVDHAQTDTYVIGFFRPGATDPVQTQTLGKPTPDGANLCAFIFTSQSLMAGTDYVAKVKAVAGTTEGIWSAASNPFDVEPMQAPTMTTAQKVKLTVVPTPAGAIPPGTLLVWSVEGSTPTNVLGTFQDVPGEFAVWYLPEKAGTHVVRLSLVVEGQTFSANTSLTVTWALPASVAITVGAPVAK